MSMRTEEMTLNMGPQHPSTHGVLRFVIKADGEVMREAVADVGYLHRSIEKIAEKVGYHGFMPYTDRVDYVCAMFTNQGWGMACERLGAIEVPKRGEYCRVIAAEFNRIASHLLSVGTMGMDIGAMTPFTHAIREREMINDLIEELCGARLTFNYMRIGGVAWDLPPGWREKALAYLDHFDPILEEYNALISYNKIYIKRLANVGVISTAEAIDYNLVGPNLRGSGFKWDIRKDIPYSVYPELDFDVPVGSGRMGHAGRRDGSLHGADEGDARVLQDPAPGAGPNPRRSGAGARCRAISSPRPANAKSASRAPAATWVGTRSATAAAIPGASTCAPGRSPRWA